MILSIKDLDLTKSYTYSDYLTWRFTEMVELIKGRIVQMSPAPASKHQTVSGNLYGQLYINLRGKKCKLFSAPFDVRFVKEIDRDVVTTVLQPDLCVICDRSKIDERGCLGSPDFIIEILSPNTQKLDLIEKYAIYEEYGVKEYWIVYPKDEIIDTFILVNDKYMSNGKYTREDSIKVHSLPDLTIDLRDIFEEEDSL